MRSKMAKRSWMVCCCVLLAATIGCSDAVILDDEASAVEDDDRGKSLPNDGKADALKRATTSDADRDIAPSDALDDADDGGTEPSDSLDDDRVAAPVCGGIQGIQCAPDQYCNLALGDGCLVSDAQGRCNTRPEACTKELDPVCGCDYQTYDNPCLAALAGVSVLHEGECPTFCESTDDCARNEVCFEGFCRLVPGACDDPFDCGDEQFCNDEGFCEDAPIVCGGFLGVPCPDGQFCDVAQGDGCYVSDAQGVCVDVQSPCPRVTVDAQVCGCDGKTYASECIANQNGMSVDYDGPCQAACTSTNDCSFGEVCDAGTCAPGPTVCGGIQGIQCGQGQYCDYDQKTACGDSDFQGTCRTVPFICPDIYEPVCGCNGQTYDNQCWAQQHGVDYRYEGPCVERE